MAWYRSGTVTSVAGQNVITGTGTQWANNVMGVAPGQALVVQRSDGNTLIYEILAVDSNTKIRINGNVVDALSASNYGIQTSVANSYSALARETSAQLALYQQLLQDWQLITTGTGNVSIIAPDGSTVVIPSLSDLTAWVNDSKTWFDDNRELIENAGEAAAVAKTLANLGFGDVAHHPQLTGVVGTSRNAKMSIPVTLATATFTADELIVQTALGGLQYKLSSFSKRVNLATVGAGGMDTGTVPVTGFVALYAIYNPTTKISALLAVNTTSVFAPEICGGVIPLGYTASALVGVLPIRSSKFRPSYLAGRTVSFELTPVYISSSVSSPVTRLDISAAVPKNATLAKGVCSAGGASSVGGYSSIRICSNLALVGEQEVRLGGQVGSGSDIVGNFAVNVIEQQSLYFSFSSNMTGAISSFIKISSYEF